MLPPEELHGSETLLGRARQPVPARVLAGRMIGGRRHTHHSLQLELHRRQYSRVAGKRRIEDYGCTTWIV